MELGDRYVDLMKETAKYMHDNEQRSALGILDSHLRGGRVDVVKELRLGPGDIPLDRDTLAMVMIGMTEGVERKEASRASHEARDFINEPYRQDPKMRAWREERIEKGSLGRK